MIATIANAIDRFILSDSACNTRNKIIGLGSPLMGLLVPEFPNKLSTLNAKSETAFVSKLYRNRAALRCQSEWDLRSG
jgi:hypothetical protein